MKPKHNVAKELEISENLNFFAMLPCPLKVPFEDHFSGFMQKQSSADKHPLSYQLVANANYHTAFSEYVKSKNSIDELPDIMMAPGFNIFFESEFVKNFVDADLFENVVQYDREIGGDALSDPAGHYSVLASNSLIIAADQTRVRSLPESWGDLLAPDMEKNLIIRGDEETFCETVLTYFYSDFGLDGIKSLGRSVVTGMHPAQMVKLLNAGAEGSPGVCVLPYFYAKLIQNKNVAVVFPKEGALLNPIFMLVKKTKKGELRELVDYLAGDDVARLFNSTGFPSTVRANEQHPCSHKLHWLGWDYIKSHNIGAEVRHLNEVFMSCH